ncbi:MAG: flagellar protein FlaG [Pseudomonadota bacterium]|nr:flagellar protein FlaG [Pseudomonadota bacterium]
MDLVSLDNGRNLAVSNADNSVLREQENKAATKNLLQSDNSGGVNAGLIENSSQAAQNDADNLEQEEPSEEQLTSALRDVEKFLNGRNRNLAFSIDEETRRSVVTVKDSSSGDVIRQIPSDEVLKLARQIQDLQDDIGSRVGVLLNKEA